MLWANASGGIVVQDDVMGTDADTLVEAQREPLTVAMNAPLRPRSTDVRNALRTGGNFTDRARVSAARVGPDSLP
jgi:hypothetical protein